MSASRKIVAGLFMSLDGVVEAPETWHFPYVDEEMGEAVESMHAAADTLLLGRTTYESFAAVWPDQVGALADKLNDIRKLVASTTLAKTEWTNTSLIDGDVIEAVAGLKRQPGKAIHLSGSLTLTRALLHAGLVDELRLLVHPIVLGSGRRLFPEGATSMPVELVRSATFSTGVVDLTYRTA
ncbi:dihydrofolate reductase family protein [Streptomyces sp. NBC_01506]|uniref:dihydrofolate reductase family protein n=1 Tax=Streptomyces sp. NBC_01506 TaxID=2903887 RepID=UPI00386F5226